MVCMRWSSGSTDLATAPDFRWLALLGLLIFSVGCESEDAKQCRAQYLQAHALVSGVDTGDLESVEQALDLVNPTLEICKRASLAEEQDQLVSVKRKLESHRDYLQHSQSQKKLSPEEVEKLVANGDPSCPKGSAYMYQKSDKKIRCTGPQIVDMNWKQVTDYFTHRSFKLHEEGATLKAESGSVSYTYEFSKAKDSKAASCLVVFSTPGIAWQETASRLTGVRPQRIKEGEPIKTAGGKKPLKVEDGGIQAIVKIGDCG